MTAHDAMGLALCAAVTLTRVGVLHYDVGTTQSPQLFCCHTVQQPTATLCLQLRLRGLHSFPQTCITALQLHKECTNNCTSHVTMDDTVFNAKAHQCPFHARKGPPQAVSKAHVSVPLHVFSGIVVCTCRAVAVFKASQPCWRADVLVGPCHVCSQLRGLLDAHRTFVQHHLYGKTVFE